MTAYFPAQMPKGKLDQSTPRVAVRSDTQSGFIFLNNYQKDHPLPEQKGVQVQLKLASGTVNVPRKPVDIPSGAYTFWPVNLPVGGALLAHATAQPLCRLGDPDTLLFFTWPGIAPEFVFEAAAGVTIEAPQARVKREKERVVVDGISPGLGIAIEIRTQGGHRTQILLLSREQARNIWKASLGGRERLVYSAADVYFEGDQIHLSATDPARLGFAAFPGPDGEIAGFRRAASQGIFQGYMAAIEPVDVKPEVRQVQEAGSAAPVRMGQEVALAPPESAFDGAARWSIRIPDVNSASVGEVLLRVTYQGDIARLYAGGRLITDDFYHGAPWEIGLRHIAAEDLKQGLELKILPLRQDAPIYLGAGARPAIPAGGQVAHLTEVRALPEYRIVADLRPR
jgi:beta-galactosidase